MDLNLTCCDNQTETDTVWLLEEVRHFRESLYTFRQPVNVAIITLYIPVFLLALLGNTLVVVVILTHREMRNVTNYLLLNLAIADLLVTLMCMPLTVGELVYRVWIYGYLLCKISLYIQGVCVCASVLTIMTLSLDRYIVIRHPVRARTVSTTSHVLSAIVIIWLLSAAIMVPLVIIRTYSHHTLPDGDVLKMCQEQWPSLAARRAFDIFLFVFIYMIPGLVVVFCYTSTGCRLMQVPLHRQESDVYKSNRIIAGRRRAALMLLTVALLFAASWLPYHAVSLHVVLGTQSQPSHSLVVLSFALLLGHSHSAQNPVIYYLMNNQFRMALRASAKCQRAALHTGSTVVLSRKEHENHTVERTKSQKRAKDYVLMSPTKPLVSGLETDGPTHKSLALAESLASANMESV